MKVFKVWIQVELVDDEHDHFENQGEPELLGEFKRAAEAQQFAAELGTIGDVLKNHFPKARID